MSASTLFIIFLLVVGCIWAGVAYQRLSKSRDNIDLAFEEIDVFLKHRHEITPRLLELLTGHQFVDASLTSALLQARHMMANAAVKIRTFSNDTPSINSLANANTAYTQALNKVLTTASRCPAIQNDARINSMLADVEKIENAIASGRQHYNNAVTLYNDQCAAFPTLLIATLLGFRCAGILRCATISNTASATKNTVPTGIAALR
jgi:hypothetical protein